MERTLRCAGKMLRRVLRRRLAAAEREVQDEDKTLYDVTLADTRSKSL